MDIKVSVIIPIYNVEKYLSQCLDSVLSQTLENIEVICVDDGSTDDSVRILAEYLHVHSNMIILTQQNSGSGLARNSGLEIARGEYVIFLDPDDFFISNDALEALYYKAQTEQVFVCGGNIVKYVGGIFSKEFAGNRAKHCSLKDERILFKDYQYPYGHGRYIISRRLLLENNINYPDYRRGQDIVFLCKVLVCAKEFYVVNKDIYAYRLQHKEEIFTRKKTEDAINATLDVMSMALDNKFEDLFFLMLIDINKMVKLYLYTVLMEGDDWELISKVNDMLYRGEVLFKRKLPIDYLMNKDKYMLYLKKLSEENDKYDELLEKNKEIVIYGAGLWGKKIYRYLKDKKITPKYFVVSNKEQNVSDIDGIPIISIIELEQKPDMLVFIGVPDVSKGDVKKILKEYDFCNVLDFNYHILSLKNDKDIAWKVKRV